MSRRKHAEIAANANFDVGFFFPLLCFMALGHQQKTPFISLYVMGNGFDEWRKSAGLAVRWCTFLECDVFVHANECVRKKEQTNNVPLNIKLSVWLPHRTQPTLYSCHGDKCVQRRTSVCRLSAFQCNAKSQDKSRKSPIRKLLKRFKCYSHVVRYTALHKHMPSPCIVLLCIHLHI